MYPGSCRNRNSAQQVFFSSLFSFHPLLPFSFSHPRANDNKTGKARATYIDI